METRPMVDLTLLWKCEMRTILTISSWKTPQCSFQFQSETCVLEAYDNHGFLNYPESDPEISSWPTDFVLEAIYDRIWILKNMVSLPTLYLLQCMSLISNFSQWHLFLLFMPTVWLYPTMKKFCTASGSSESDPCWLCWCTHYIGLWC